MTIENIKQSICMYLLQLSIIGLSRKDFHTSNLFYKVKITWESGMEI